MAWAQPTSTPSSRSTSRPTPRLKAAAQLKDACSDPVVIVGKVCIPRTLYLAELARAMRGQAKTSFAQFMIPRKLRNDFIQLSLLAQYARQIGLRITATERRKHLHRAPYFLNAQGKFDPAKFTALINKRYKIRTEDYYAQIERILLNQKLVLLFERAFAPDRATLRNYHNQQFSRVRLRYLRLNATKFSIPRLHTKAELQRFLQSNESALRQQYRKDFRTYNRPTQVRARHILLRLDPKASAAKVAAVRTRLQSILDQAKAKPESFGQLARTYSEGPSKAAGGDLGFFRKGQMVPAFEKAVFALKAPMALSAPVRTRFGFHLIQLTAKRPGKTQSFDQVKAQLARQAMEAKANAPLLKAGATQLLQQWQKRKSPQAVLAALKQLKQTHKGPQKALALSVAPNAGALAHALWAALDTKLTAARTPWLYPYRDTKWQSKVGAQLSDRLQFNRPLLLQAGVLTKAHPFVSHPVRIGPYVYLLTLHKQHIPDDKDFQRRLPTLRQKYIDAKLQQRLNALLRTLQQQFPIKVPSKRRPRP